MSSTDYSYFNPNNYNSPVRAITDLFVAPKLDYHMLPLYSVHGTQLMTYILVGVTAVVLGYVSIQENESEKSPASEESESQGENPKSGGKKKSKKSTRKNKKHSSI